MRKIYIIGSSTDYYINWMEGVRVETMEKADFVVLTGGEDINPMIYNKKAHYTTDYNPKRDLFEVEEFAKARALNKPIVGICRGSQLLCAMAGGILVQNQELQPHIHAVNTYDGKIIYCTSTHHQAQYPWVLPKDEFKVLGWTNGLSSFHRGENDADELINDVIPNTQEVEIALYPKIKALAIQMHPEMMFHYRKDYSEAKESIKYFRDLLTKFLKNQL
jgi:putative glutamine amidotransferase